MTAITWRTYRLASGDSIYGEYAWMDTDDWACDLDPGEQIVREEWVLVKREIGTVHGLNCQTCEGEGIVADPGIAAVDPSDWSDCSDCNGTGEWQGDQITWAPDNGSRRPDPVLIERICEAVPSVTPNQVADVLRALGNGREDTP